MISNYYSTAESLYQQISDLLRNILDETELPPDDLPG